MPYIRCNSLVKVTACIFNNISKWQQERRVWEGGKGGVGGGGVKSQTGGRVPKDDHATGGSQNL